MTLEKITTKIPDCRIFLVSFTFLLTSAEAFAFYTAIKIDEPTPTKFLYAGATLASAALTAYLANKFYR